MRISGGFLAEPPASGHVSRQQACIQANPPSPAHGSVARPGRPRLQPPPDARTFRYFRSWGELSANYRFLRTKLLPF